jgi:adenylate kinase family enzyme
MKNVIQVVQMENLLNKMILEGKMVPGEIPVNLIKKTLVKHEWNGKKYLVDGFPRNSEN